MAEVNQTEAKSPIMPILKKLEIGESYSYPCARMKRGEIGSVSSASDYGESFQDSVGKTEIGGDKD